MLTCSAAHQFLSKHSNADLGYIKATLLMQKLGIDPQISALDYKSTEKLSQEHEKGRCSGLPMKWSDGQRTGDENAPTAALGCPKTKPGILAPDIITKNLTFGTLVRAVP